MQIFVHNHLEVITHFMIEKEQQNKSACKKNA